MTMARNNKAAVPTPADVVLPALPVCDVEVTAALTAPIADGALEVLCLLIVLVLLEVDEVEVVLEVVDDELLLVFDIELLLIFVFPLTH